MNFRVIYTSTFRQDISEHVDYLRDQHVPDDIIERWYDRLFSRIDDLGNWPKSCPVDEQMTEVIGREVRKLVYARHVVTYHVDEQGRSVQVLTMVHGARRK